ncbi:MAG: aminotransferase class V-fold PLP-dependent enzyme, partial [Bdellovibrionales bacterium]|nr:aminotransferase class V-fold PLP-dependent enzyme [Bdellovibrionales bacterium]
MFYNFDTNATYGLLPGVASKLSSYNNTLFNPSSIHSLGQNSRILIEESRERLRAFLGAEKSSRIIYTSGATEANNSAIFSPFTEYLKKYGPNERAKLTLITTSVEHPSVLEACKKLDEYGFDVVYLDVDKNGYLNFERLVETLN